MPGGKEKELDRIRRSGIACDAVNKTKMEEYMKKYLLIAIAIVSVLLTITACASDKAQTTGVDQATRDKVFATVSQNLPNLQDIYHVLSKDNGMTGVLNITLFIDEKGDVKSVKVEPVEGNLNKDMLKAVKDEVALWKFTTEVKMNYQFKATFNKM